MTNALADRYALTLRIMLANLRRKVGLRSGISTPAPTLPPPFSDNMMMSPTFHDPTMPPPITMEEIGFTWPNDRGTFSPSSIPLWLQEQVCNTNLFHEDTAEFTHPQSLADLGLPVNGSDGIFLQMAGKNGWTGDYAHMPEAW